MPAWPTFFAALARASESMPAMPRCRCACRVPRAMPPAAPASAAPPAISGTFALLTARLTVPPASLAASPTFSTIACGLLVLALLAAFDLLPLDERDPPVDRFLGLALARDFAFGLPVDRVFALD